MKVVMVGGHGCIRQHKMAIPLIERGHEVHLVQMKISSFWEQYKTFSLCADLEQVIEALRLHAKSDVDLFHCHNEPSWFVTALKEITDKPVILDVHDSYLARSTPEEATEALDREEKHVRVSAEERNNFQAADALVFPGLEFGDLICNEFGLTQPRLILPSYVPKRFYQYSQRDWHGGLVYEGKVNLPSETKGYSSGFKYCDYTELFKECTELGMDFHLYSARVDDKLREYIQPYEKVFLHKPLLYEELMKSLGRHDWGLVGNVSKTREWDVAFPNKLFEYIACGMPVVSMNSRNCSRFIEGTGMGITVESAKELAERWPEHREARNRVIAERQKWSMNAHINELEDFYRAVI